MHTVKLNGGRCVSGVLRGFDPYMNLVLDDCLEERSATQKYKIGMVVSGNRAVTFLRKTLMLWL